VAVTTSAPTHHTRETSTPPMPSSYLGGSNPPLALRMNPLASTTEVARESVQLPHSASASVFPQSRTSGMFQTPSSGITPGWQGALWSRDQQLTGRRPADGAHQTRGWDDVADLEAKDMQLIDRDQTCRGGYRVLTKPRSYSGTADSLRTLQYHHFGDISNPTSVSPFYNASPSSYAYALGHSSSVVAQPDRQRELESQGTMRRQGNRAEASSTVIPASSSSAASAVLAHKITAMNSNAARSLEADELYNRSVKLQGELDQFTPGEADKLKYGARGMAHTTHQGSPYPKDNLKSAKATAMSRVQELQAALQNETKGMAKCY